MNIDIEKLNYVTKEDTFNFHCTCCGACCRHREDILLNAYDIFRMMKHLKLSFQEFIEKYCECYVGHTSLLPVIRLRPKGTNRNCPLLSKGKCIVHEAKPVVCAMFPLGRLYNGETKEIQYFIQDVNCGAKDTEVKVEDWLNSFAINDQCFVIWTEITATLSMFLRENPMFQTELYYNLMFEIMYGSFNLEEDFVYQLQGRLLQVKKLIEVMKALPKKN